MRRIGQNFEGTHRTYDKIAHLHAWARGRPVPVAIVAHVLASSTIFAADLIAWVRSGDVARAIYDHVSEPDWLHLYRSPESVRQVIKSFGMGLPGNTTTSSLQNHIYSQSPGAARKAQKLLESAPEEYRRQAMEAVCGVFGHWYIEHCREIVDTLRGMEGENFGADIDMDESMRKPEMQFFILVVIPCFLEYGQSPWRLYANARRGNKESLDSLLRLDKTIIREERLSPMLARFGMERAEYDTAWVVRAYEDSPATRQAPENIKARLAAHLQDVAKSLGYTLRPSDLRDLFDALAKDYTGDHLAIDTDLQEDPAAWRQAIKRARKGDKRLKPFWKLQLPRDQSKRSKCHAELMRLAVVSDFDESEPLPDWFTAPPEDPKRSSRGRWWSRLRAKCKSTAQRLQAAFHRA